MMQTFILLLALAQPSFSLDNGLALTPPMGWRSWNCFKGDVTDADARRVADAMVSRRRSVDGVPTSLLDLGYTDLGVDDGWQACGAG